MPPKKDNKPTNGNKNKKTPAKTTKSKTTAKPKTIEGMVDKKISSGKAESSNKVAAVDTSHIDSEIRKAILAEEEKRLVNKIDYAARKAKAELAIRDQPILSIDEERACVMKSEGKTFVEIAQELGKALHVVREWFKRPELVRHCTDLTMKFGLSDKVDRVQKQRRVVDKAYEIFFQREEELTNMPLDKLGEFLLKHSDKFDKLLEKKDDNIENKDLTVLIMNFAKENNNKEYRNIDEFMSDDEYSYPTIDVNAE